MSEKKTRSSKKPGYKGPKNSNRKDNRRNSKKQDSAFNFNNIEKIGKNFMYHNLTKSKCYNSNFSNSNFDYVCFRGAHMKSCFFAGCSFTGAEFVGSNLKESKFAEAKFENTVFESVKLEGADFKDAVFKNTIFLASNLEGVKNLNLEDENIRVFETMPQADMSDALRQAVEKAMENKYVKKARVLDTREGKINDLSVIILLENFDEETLINGLNSVDAHIDRDFFTLSFIIKLINKLKKDGVI